MIRRKHGKIFTLIAALILSLAFSGLASAAGLKTIKKEDMELFHLRQASEMYGYSIEWNDKERSVTMVYMDKMDDGMMSDDDMMTDDTMMTDDDMMTDDTMMTHDTMMKGEMKPAGEMIKLWIGSKEIMVNGKQISLDTAPILYDGSTYVVEELITQYMKPGMAMNEMN